MSPRRARSAGKAGAAKKKPVAKKAAGVKKLAGKTPVAKKAAAKKPAATQPAARKQGSGEVKAKTAAALVRAPGERRYWLLKSEPMSYSFDDLMAAPDRTTHWDGVRNHVAKSLMRDGMRAGDLVLFYHSSADPTAVVGIAEVVREAYPDHTAFDPADSHFDEKSRREAPTWFMVDIRAREPLRRPLELPELRATPGLEGMELLRQGSRLSVQPVSAEEFAIVARLGGVSP